MRFKKYCTFILVLALSGCFAGRENNGKGLNAEDPMLRSRAERGGEPFDWNAFRDREMSSFRIMSVNANVNTNTQYINTETEQHEAVAVDFTVVLEHRGTAQRLLGHRFRVSGYHGEEVFNLEVQENNVISWTEVIEFDPLRPQFDPVLVVKKIEGLGASTGHTHAVFELNPWAYFNGDLGRAFFDLTYSVDVLNRRYPNFDPAFNYVRHLQEPETEAPSLNIGSARFYINREETAMIMSDISSEDPVRMYEPSSLEARAEREQVQIPLDSSSIRDIDRGDLVSEPERNYVTRDQVMTRYAREEAPARGVRLKLGANLRLQTEISNGGATTSFNTINNGRFRVFAALIGSNQGLYDDMGDEEKILLGINASPVVGEINDQILNVEFEMFTNNITNRGDLDLAIKVVPLQRWAEAGVEPFSVVYKLGTFGDLLGFSGDFRDIESSPTDFDFDEYLGEVRDFTDRHRTWLLDNGFLAEAHDIIFDSMRIKFRTVKAGETATQRTVIFDVTSCPREGLSGRKLTEGRQFKVLVSGLDPLKCSPQDYTLPDGSENPVCRFDRVPIEEIRQDGGTGTFEVQNTGCLAWVDEIAHKYYQRENLIERSYHVIDPQTNEEIFKLDGYFNPWDEKFGTLGVDARNLSESFIEEIRSREKLPSRFFVGDFSYMTLRFRYDIDENMHLTVKKTVLMNLYPFVKRYSNIINGINGNFPIRDGVYLLKVAYQKDYIDPGANGIDLQRTGSGDNVSTRVAVENGNTGANRHDDPFVQDDLRRKTFVHIIKKLIRVENNRVITPVEFHINELRTLRVRSNLLLQLEPVNQYKLQIVNLLERHIAHKLGLEIGNLGAARCLTPGLLDGLLDLFQKTIDEIALSIPDDINYTSEASFREVIESEAITSALSNLTEHGLLEGLSSAFGLAMNEEQVRDAFRFLSGGDLAGLESTDELQRAIEEARSQVLLGQREAVGILSQLSDQASRGLVEDPDSEGLRDHEGFIAPFNTEDMEGLNPQAEQEAPGHALGSDVGDVSEAVEGLEGTLQQNGAAAAGLTVDEHTQEFLDEVTRSNELETLLKNDFTIDPAITRVSDLDYLIDRKAGIIRRTFVGPLTLLALDNKNVMNATDALDYGNASNDGAQDQTIRNSYGDDFNSDYARNPNFGYQGHFKNCHVDDFIVEGKHEDLIHDAWAECVSSLPRSAEGEVTIPEGFTCDYEQTNAYQNYLRRQNNEIWTEVDEYNSSPFKRFARHSDERRMVNEGSCPYREVWLKKFFSQKMVQKAQSQFGNFLSYPSVTAKVVQPIEQDLDHRSTAMKVEAIDQSCIEQGRISEACVGETDRFNLSVSDFADSLLNTDNSRNVRDYFYDPRRELDDTPYKGALEEFYSRYNRSTLRTLEREGDQARINLSKDIYRTLVQIAAPPVELHPRISYEDKLAQVAPADFGRDVQKFLCNIMLPRADKSYHTFFEWFDNASDDDFNYDEYRHPDNPELLFPNTEAPIVNRNFFDGNLTDRVQGVISFNSRREQLYNRFKRALNSCREYANSNSVEIPLPFIVERKFRTLELGRYFFRGGKSINFATTQSVGVGHSLNVSNKYTLDPINSLKDWIKNLVSNVPVLGHAGSLVGGAVKFHDYTQSESNGVSDGKGLGTSAHLSMQAAELDLELSRYRRCMLVRWNKDFLKDALDEDIEIFSDIIPAMNNIFVCGGEENEPVAIRENYYYVTQHFTEGDLLDSGSLLNNPWLLTLRGYRDMITFVRSLYPSSQFADDAPNVLNLMADDYNRLVTKRPVFVPVSLRYQTERGTNEEELEPWLAMSMAYRNVTPSFPGLFTQLNNKEASLPNWPWTNEGQLREQGDRSCDARLENN